MIKEIKLPKIEDSRGKTSTSDSEGKFIIEGDYYPTTPLKLTISLKDYGTETVTISKEDGGIRNDLNVFKLKTTKVSADDEILKNTDASYFQPHFHLSVKL